MTASQTQHKPGEELVRIVESAKRLGVELKKLKPCSG